MEKNIKRRMCHFAVQWKLAQHCKSTILQKTNKQETKNHHQGQPANRGLLSAMLCQAPGRACRGEVDVSHHRAGGMGVVDLVLQAKRELAGE